MNFSEATVCERHQRYFSLSKESRSFALLKYRDNNLQAASKSAVLEAKMLSYYLVKEALAGE